MTLKLLPDYVVINNSQGKNTDVLRQHAQSVKFPLSQEDLEDIRILEAKYDAEEVCAGLAAPQIGIGKRIIIFAVPDEPALKKWRSDLEQTMPKTIWLNPIYEPIGEETREDYEACFSVDDTAAPVKRYVKIRYYAYSVEGKPLQGIAEGYLARVIQHEVDHTNGILFIDRTSKESLLSMAAYKEMRARKMQEANSTNSE